jgi:hypothetical protein
MLLGNLGAAKPPYNTKKKATLVAMYGFSRYLPNELTVLVNVF